MKVPSSGRWLRGIVTRLVHGERDWPYTTLARVARQVRTLRLPDILRDLAVGLRAPYAAIETAGVTVASWGEPALANDGAVRVALEAADEHLGELILAVRAKGETYSPSEVRLIGDLAGPLAYALHDQRLAAQLHDSREQLVVAREEERRRLRRTLHDEVAPTVAALGLKAQTARAMLARGTDPATMDALLSAIIDESAIASSSLRALSYDLRPPALDERGLLDALRDRAGDLAPTQARFEVVGDWSQPLSAAVEVATYRIVTSALANVAKHAKAGQVAICLFRSAEEVRIRVLDDGRGLPPGARHGVGLTAMGERAAELGGECTVRNRSDRRGTVVEATLPVGWRHE